MCGACICVYGFICPCTHLQRLKDDAGCFLLISTIFLRQNLSLNPELGFPARWVASESPVILFHLLLVLGLQACIGDGFLSYMGSGDLNLGSYAYIVKSSNLLNHPLMPWQNIFSLLIWVVDSHDQIDGFFPIVMISIWRLSHTNAYLLKILFQCHIQKWGFLRSYEVMPILTSLIDEPIDRFIMLQNYWEFLETLRGTSQLYKHHWASTVCWAPFSFHFPCPSGSSFPHPSPLLFRLLSWHEFFVLLRVPITLVLQLVLSWINRTQNHGLNPLTKTNLSFCTSVLRRYFIMMIK